MPGLEAISSPEIDHGPREHCGVFGIYVPKAAELGGAIASSLMNLQHRGQDAAGIAVNSYEGGIVVTPGEGLVSESFTDRELRGMGEATIGIGHTRYATSDAPGMTTEKWRRAIQPIDKNYGTNVNFALGENGHSDQAQRIATELGFNFNDFASDTDFKAELIAKRAREIDNVEKAVIDVLPMFDDSAFSMTIMTKDELIAVRDPRGFRPLVWGELPNGGYAVASEVAGLSILGIDKHKEVMPGEMLVFDKNGVRSQTLFEPKEPKLCLFEFVYTSRPDNEMYERTVWDARFDMGRELARLYRKLFDEGLIKVDYVSGVPESGVIAAHGFAEEIGRPYRDIFVKNRYVGRSFIQPTAEKQKKGVRDKLNPLPHNIVGQRLAVIDDSRIRGTTSNETVEMLWEAGAKELHLFLTSPQYLYSCYYGMQTGDHTRLSARKNSIEQEALEANVTSLHYLPLENLRTAVGRRVGERVCTACFTGDYPTDVSVKLGPPAHGDSRLSYIRK